ncbi:unnamed protein product [Blepharisma stoltei]|uniref:Uncharacterized protein n=1 Tax=Blepharisma stoltei TaxID=1481888 RepID=A0AAU9J4N0_9CILI|nr:unnamed protein product [Blepharisma stoltei]
MFLISKENTIKFLHRAPLKHKCFTIYYQNFIYFIGNNYVERLNLTTYKWEILIISLWNSVQVVGASLSNMILISGYSLTGIYALDLLTLSTSRCFIRFDDCRMRTLCTVKDVAYLIDFSGKILRSGINNPFSWEIVGDWSPDSLIMFEYRAFYKGCWYFFVASDQIYKFDFDKGKYEIMNYGL